MISRVLSNASKTLACRQALSFKPVQFMWPSTSLLSNIGAIGQLSRLFSTDLSGYNSKVCTILGAQWGDEGKGKLVDILAGKYDIVARFNGGSNAGHTLVVNGQKFAFHLLPCGMLYDDTINVIGNGVVLHVPTMLTELENLEKGGKEWKGRLKISDRAHLLFDFHRIIDGRQEEALGAKSVGTTKKGIGPCYTSKMTRNGVRVGELRYWESFKERYLALVKDNQQAYGFSYDTGEELARFEQYRELLLPMLVDSVHYLNSELAEGKSILAEGANAALLDIDFGTYPYVTSSATTAGGISTGLGIAPSKIDTAIGIVKAYTTRVGSGPFPTELQDSVGELLGKVGHEFGTTTGRPRRCGWLDLPVVNYSNLLNGYTSLNITKLDVLSDLPELKLGVSYSIDGKELPFGMMPSNLQDLAKVVVNYETLPGWQCDISNVTNFDDLPPQAKQYLARIEQITGVPVSWVGTGPGRDAMVTKGFEKL
eukprot:CAMPEP_0175127390 /NCGR_PEP_ID=MMETSP0087-20121206/4361_1 /TAXON_ID=136419 /ORGANISM="Unknown Unknown, Strain D1" /LENGTH=481 /DNA_ID=CAMNT_0016409365 /DNA_START=21 /DNA_END=1466 /DNA_ORIENTATION=+